MDNKVQQNQRRKPKQARALAKYNAVLDACTQVLQRNGYAKTSMIELSLESGVAVPTIYQYFENKEEIFVAWINRVIDNILAQVSSLEGNLQDEHLETYIDVLMQGALVAVSAYRGSIKELISGVPHVLSSRVITTMEDKTVSMVEDLFSEQISNIENENIHFKITTLVRLTVGYFLQRLMGEDESIDAFPESAELAIIVKLYLKDGGVKL